MDLSGKVMSLLSEYSQIVQPISIDEAFIDVSEIDKTGFTLAKDIQANIRDHLHLPASLGVASNKLVAKVATNVGKASVKTDGYPYAIQVVPPGEEAAFLAPLPSDALWGIGPKTAEKLAKLGIHTIDDIVKFPVRELARMFGQTGTDLHRRAQGIDNSPVHISHETKSVSHEETFSRDTGDEKVLRETLSYQSQSLSKQLRKQELFGSTVRLKLRWPDFTTFTRQKTLLEPTDDAKSIEAAALDLLRTHWKAGRKVRLIGLGMTKLSPPSHQTKLWDWDPKEFEKQERLEGALKALHAKYGDASVRRASSLKSS
jgi:DNA polymerase-4